MRAPIAEGGGYAWFANRGIGRPVAESLRATMDWFRDWLDDVAPAGRPVVLVGFSGGAAFAGGLLLDDPARYAGAAILYGTLPFDAGVPTTAARLDGVPVLVAHGEQRHRHPPRAARPHLGLPPRRRRLRDDGRPRPGGHGISPAALAELQRWLTDVLAERRSPDMTTHRPFEIGLFTFGEITADPAKGRPLDPAVRLRGLELPFRGL